MRRKPRNPDEYVFYEGIDNLDFPVISNLEADENQLGRREKVSKKDIYRFEKNEEFANDTTGKINYNLQDIFDKTDDYLRNEDFADFVTDNKFILTSEEEFRQKNFKDFLELKYETKLPKSFSSSFVIPAESIKQTDEIVEIHDDPSKLTGTNKHRATVLIKKDNNDVIQGIQVICVCGERINISFDYQDEEINTQSEYEEQSPQE
ncbi:MAG: hypothetical protein N2319_10915 [Candidatus Kapabacteria bacterium]|nr:hypothetical protein [Candidatus Kapabacteria bacterium]